ncbi:hypothetical protein TBLA_0A08150 [Henningerozyma blattae CBS 6284]|uniref:1-acyl-sn-glycerol-3-phosphate acyltransferase n=1 Tax=Henningerozyma blattae (strain ATCC 34711 / CBS 6284 / DSM 70876 / NBRC 10599 / NRRL Y-10934 / UCD 77-7) TaxID=1071380 RepID=I2GWV3_HENB6|nr:hypothetical protein TBLA_0A08150 [Tetrapisispora blattae CBS 6284]CCH58605.1 hypothetical protein TBLA_0A08150 [Tetrapisispora blattae CBS 6284]
MGNFKYYFRTVTLSLLLLVSALYGTIASIVLNVIGKKHLSQWATARFYYNLVKYVLGIEIRVINEDILTKHVPCIFVSNHQSTLDILMLGRMFPKGCTVTAKKSLKYIPFLGWFMALSGTYFLERSSREKSVATLNKGLEDVKRKKQSLWIFPEGTRSYSQDLIIAPFKKGAFHLAQQGKLPIVPIVVSNTSTVVASKWKVFNRGEIVVKVLPPMATDQLSSEGVSKFSTEIHDLMVNELQTIGYSKVINDTNLPPHAEKYLLNKN